MQPNGPGGQPEQGGGQPPQFGGQPPQYGGQPPQYGIAPRKYQIRRYNQRMAQRVARRAGLQENAVCVAFTFNSMFTMFMFSFVEDVLKYIPQIGDLLEMIVSLVSFYWHRVVLVTDQNIYVYRDKPFHRPGERFAAIPRGPGAVTMGTTIPDAGGWSRFWRRGQLTFSDGTVVYHGVWWILRARYIYQEGNIPPGY